MRTLSEFGNALEKGGFLSAIAGEDLHRRVTEAWLEAAKTQRGLLFVGPPGSGKTTAAKAVRRTGSFFRARNLQYPKDHALLCTGEWILDDLGSEPVGKGTEPGGDFILDIYEDFRAERWTFPPVVTTNLYGSIRASRYGQRVVSRMAEMFLPVDFAGPDRRLAARN